MISQPQQFVHQFSLEIFSETLTCHSARFLSIPHANTLVISDMHLGKIDHFRKHGIGLPTGLDRHDLALLKNILLHHKPDTCVFLGDLFHSEYNQSWDHFASLLATLGDIDFILVEGNHDILHPDLYADCQMNTFAELAIGPYFLTHEPVSPPDGMFNIHGHIHPGYHLYGKGRQHLRLPCFHFSESSLTMPAFGRFTGLHPVSPKVNDQMVLVAGEKLVCVSATQA